MLISSETKRSKVFPSLYGVAHSKNLSIFGNRGYAEFRRRYPNRIFRPIYGNFIHITKHNEAIRISTDHFGLSKLYIYRSNNNWAISDSFYQLVRYAKASGWSITAYLPSIYSFFIPGGMGHQLTSFRTIADEIELIPHWNDVVIDELGLAYKFQNPCAKDLDVRTAIANAGSFTGSLAKSYLECGFRPYLDLSAGLDARCTLAALLSSLSALDVSKLGIFTLKGQPWRKERAIVKDLSRAHGLNILEKRPPLSQPNWAQWKHNFLGTQSHFAPYPRPFLSASRFTGGSAEMVKPFYDWGGRIEGIDFGPDIRKEVKNSILSDIDSALLSGHRAFWPEVPIEFKHYQMFRNRFHFGRQVSDSVFNIPELISAFLRNYDPAEPLNNFHRLIFELGGESLLRHPFDESTKSPNPELPPSWSKITIDSTEIPSRELFFDAGTNGDYNDLTRYAEGENMPSYIQDDIYRGLLAEGKQVIEKLRSSKVLDNWCIEYAELQCVQLERNGLASNPNALRGVLALLSLEFVS